MARFVLEIGTEELPARFLRGEQTEALRLLGAALEAEGLPYERMSAHATPRRLAVIVEGLPERQPDREEIVIGPPAAIAYGADGQPSRALLGFATGNGVRPEDIFRHQTEKGEYVACRKISGGQTTKAVLARICPEVIESIPFAKRMRWGKLTVPYVRPIAWILALLDGEVVPFHLAGVESGRRFLGHRIHGRGPYELDHAANYEHQLAQLGQVVLDGEERRARIRAAGDGLAQSVGGAVIWKDGLLDEVTGLVEHPIPLLGDFDAGYLEIPEEVLLTSMETHQKSFGVRGRDGKLLPHFLTVLNISPKYMELVKKGWERVLRARLEDARFFWQSDLADNFDAWLEKLDHVIFIGPLGSMGDKSRRLEKLCQWLVTHLPPQDLTLSQGGRAGRLAKADLVSAMVGEFDTLQGIMGGIYAQQRGEDAVVAQALREQYLPAGPDTPLPGSALGAILSLADRADTLAGCFGLGQSPTGASDPNGLRRCALGIIRILIHRRWHANVADIFREAQRLYGPIQWKIPPEAALVKLLEFFRGRLRNYFTLRGYDTTFVEAVLASDHLDPADAQARLDALVAFGKDARFTEAAQTLKRVENVGKKAGDEVADTWEAELLREEAEVALGACLETLLPRLDAALAQGDYPAVLATIAETQGPVDGFFDRVLVMCDDAQTRRNRLAMLKALSKRYAAVAQFSALQL